MESQTSIQTTTQTTAQTSTSTNAEKHYKVCCKQSNKIIAHFHITTETIVTTVHSSNIIIFEGRETIPTIDSIKEILNQKGITCRISCISTNKWLVYITSFNVIADCNNFVDLYLYESQKDIVCKPYNVLEND